MVITANYVVVSRCDTYFCPNSLSSRLFSNLYLLYLFSHSEKNLRSVNPIYNHIEDKTTETPIKNRRKMPRWGNLNRILCKKKGWSVNTAVNIKHNGARINEDSIINLNRPLVLFIWDTSSSIKWMTLLLFCTFSVRFVEFFDSASLASDDIARLSVGYCLLKYFANHVTDHKVILYDSKFFSKSLSIFPKKL
jgi:hypothetical protein